MRYAEHIEKEGVPFYEEVRKLGLEEIMAKRAASPYAAGRSANCLKITPEMGDIATIARALRYPPEFSTRTVDGRSA